MTLCKTHRIASWVLQVLAAGILGQTLFFKFTAAPESVEIFAKLGAEPWGRIGSGIVELIAVVLLLTPRAIIPGALLAMGVMAGAIASHFTKLGIAIQSDGGLLFALAWVVFISAAVVLFLRRHEIPGAGGEFLLRNPALARKQQGNRCIP